MTADRTATGIKPTVSHVFGEITWLLSQSAQHRELLVNDLIWLLMPPILNRQFHIFRKEEGPVGAALWALFSAETEAKVKQSISRPKFTLSQGDWRTGDRLWLIALTAPFSNPQNKEAELMVADLIAGPFAGKPFNMIHSDPSSGRRTVLNVDANAKRYLVEQVVKRLEMSFGAER